MTNSLTPQKESDIEEPLSPAVLSQARFEEWWDSYWSPAQKMPVSVKAIARDAWLACGANTGAVNE
jgi:hypothetical protein